jgi:hypothetical protein
MFVHDCGGLVKPHYIINFPTKDHWRGKSTIGFIRDGLVDLVAQIRRLRIQSIAVPPLGCGNGGLDWAEVRPLMEAAFAPLDDVEIRLFEPAGAPPAKTMEVGTDRPRMTAGRAAILKVLETYRELRYGLSKVEVAKTCLFSPGGRRAAESAVCEAPLRSVFRSATARLEQAGGALHSRLGRWGS